MPNDNFLFVTQTLPNTNNFWLESQTEAEVWDQQSSVDSGEMEQTVFDSCSNSSMVRALSHHEKVASSKFLFEALRNSELAKFG